MVGKNSRGILEYFPKPYKPRQVQIDCLTRIESVWYSSDVIVINLPVASGKSYIAKTILDWAGKGVITTPTNILVDQYVRDFPTLAKIYGRDSYECQEDSYSSCGSRIAAYERAKCSPKTCEGCPWLKDNRKVRSQWTQKYITNNHLYVQMAKYMPLLISDESHNLTSFLQDWHSSRIDYDKYRYPRKNSGRIDRGQLKDWLNSLQNIEKILESPERGQKGLVDLYRELNSDAPRYLLREEVEEKKDGQGNKFYKNYLKLCPMDVRNMPPVLWPSGTVNKIILMSATIGPKDIEELGLSEYRVSYIEADSCIPAANRPVIYDSVGDLKASNLAQNNDIITAKIRELAGQNPNTKGLIHATYAQAGLLESILGADPRYKFHKAWNKKQVYQDFRAATDNSVLVASGMYEGVDLPEDAGRWQVIAKIPWPNLGEPAVSYRASKDKDWYAWQAAKTVQQACGRICRTPTDHGSTYIIDGTFKRLYQQNQKLWPLWFRESVSGL